MKRNSPEVLPPIPRGRSFIDRYLPQILVTPSTLIIFGVLVFPIVYALFMSVNDMNIAKRTYEFIGLENYKTMFTDKYFKNAITQTLLFTVLTVAAEIGIGVAVALVLNQEFKGRGFVRGLMILPWALPSVVNAVMWKWIFNGNYGVLNALLTNIGILDSYYVFLGKPVSAFVCVLIANIWKETPYVVLLTIAALANIPADLYEAAQIDGANSWKSFWRITLPMIRPVILILTITKTIWALQTFDLVFIMTAGGPVNVTQFIAFFIHKTSFKFQKFGYGSAMSFTLSLVCFFLTYLYIKVFMGKDDGSGKVKLSRREERLRRQMR